MAIDMFIDGNKVDLRRAFNSRGHGAARTTQDAQKNCFLGFYYDASHIEAGASHSLAIRLPVIQKGSFQGVFWENVETDFTSEVASCHVYSRDVPSPVYI